MSAAPKRPETLAPLSGADAIRLPVAAHRAAAVRVPIGATNARPVFIALHDGGKPEENCARWAAAVPPGGFILCPHLSWDVDGGGHEVRTQTELRAALTALKAKFGFHVAATPAVLVGIGRAASHAMVIAVQQPEFFAQLAIVDGGYRRWTGGMASSFNRKGGRRVLFVCTEKDCLDEVARPVAVTRTTNVETRLIDAVGQNADPVEAVAKGWGWLVERAPDWRKFARSHSPDASTDPKPTAVDASAAEQRDE